MTEQIVYSFPHGLGDHANAAALFKVYRDYGVDLAVNVSEDKRLVWELAGVPVVDTPGIHHPWPHRLEFNRPDGKHNGPWNKTWGNIGWGVMPDIASPGWMWQKILEQKPPGYPSTVEMDQAGDQLKATGLESHGSTVLVHTKGNTSPEQKSLPDDWTRELYRELSQYFDRIVLLDWDNRVPYPVSSSIIHINDLSRPFTLEHLYALMCNAVVIGIDSGPLHYARWTRCKRIVGVWHGYHPAATALPDSRALHFTQRRPENHDIRGIWNLIEYDGNLPTPKAVAEAAFYEYKDYYEYLIDNTSYGYVGNYLVDRTRTLLHAFGRLAYGCRKEPLIVETGCIRQRDDWSAGYFGYIAACYAQWHGGRVICIDNEAGHLETARKLLRWTDRVSLVHSDSVAWLPKIEDTIDLLYLDSMDVGVDGYEDHCLNEAKAGLPKLAPKTGQILIDDTFWHDGRWHGKGAKAVPWLKEQGLELYFSGRQVLFYQRDEGSSDDT